jgi:hypothetical protein
MFCRFCARIGMLYVLQVLCSDRHAVCSAGFVLFEMCLEVDVSWVCVHLSNSDDNIFRVVRRFNDCCLILYVMY